MEVLGWIPARSGSKGIPNKNLAPLGGQPLIAWTIQAAMDSHTISRVIVSTDSDAIAAVAQEFGAETIMRPDGLSGDSADVDDALRHTLGYMVAREGYEPDIVTRLQPTSPLRGPEYIDVGVHLLQGGCKAVIGLVRPDRHPYLLVSVGAHGYLDVDPGLYQPRQVYPAAFAISGAFYGARTDYWWEHGFYGPELIGMVLPRCVSYDIDEPHDLAVVEALIPEREIA